MRKSLRSLFMAYISGGIRGLRMQVYNNNSVYPFPPQEHTGQDYIGHISISVIFVETRWILVIYIGNSSS